MRFCSFFAFLNGFDKIIYTDYYATNLVNIAEAVTNDPDVPESSKDRFYTNIETEKPLAQHSLNKRLDFIYAAL